MMETLMVSIVFVVILLVALAFFFKFQLDSFDEKGDRSCIVSNTVLLSTVTSMPEIQCSSGTKTENCIDTSKLMVFNPAREYGTLFTTNCNQKVYFTQLSPEVEEETCSTSTYPRCNKYDFYIPEVEYLSSTIISTPATLYFPLTNEYKFGKLTVEVLQ
jgi:hypothetical protein